MRQNRLLKYVSEEMVEGRIEVTERLGRRCKQLVDDVKKKRGYWKLTEEEPDRRLRRFRFEGIIEVKIEVTERLGRRCKQLVDDVKKTRGYWKLTEEEPDRRLRRFRFGRGYGPIVRQTTA